MNDDDVQIILRPGAHPQAPKIRLRQAMKILLRAFNLRCVDIRVIQGSDGSSGIKSLKCPHKSNAELRLNMRTGQRSMPKVGAPELELLSE